MNQLEDIVSNTFTQVMRVFDDIAIAEDEIARAQKRNPDQAEVIDKGFRLLIRPQFMRSDALYRKHIRELLRRVVEGKDCRPGTRAEALAALSEASLAVKFNRSGMLASATLLHEVMGDVSGVSEIVNNLQAIAGREEYAGSTAADIEGIRKKLTVADRVYAG